MLSIKPALRFCVGLFLDFWIQPCVSRVGAQDTYNDLAAEDFAEIQKNYKNVTEKRYRQKIFETNKVELQRLNKLSHGDSKGPIFGINQFADLTPAEFKALLY